MCKHWRLAGVAAVLMLTGCARTEWVRPGTSTEEAQIVLNRCDYEADLGTSPTNTHYWGRPTLGKEVAVALVDALSDAFRQASLKNKCMMANGFMARPVQPAPPIQAASALDTPLTEPDISPMMASRDVAVPRAEPAKYIVLNPPAPGDRPAAIGSYERGPVTSVKLDGPRILSIRAELPPTPVNQRQLITQQFMGMSDSSKLKASFLLGACSAGDASACIMSEALRPSMAQR